MQTPRLNTFATTTNVETAALEADEREEAAWSKLSGYAARLAWSVNWRAIQTRRASPAKSWRRLQSGALVWQRSGPYLRQPSPRHRSKRGADKLVEFIETRGGEVTVREVMQSYWPLKNKREETESALNRLVVAGVGEVARGQTRRTAADRPTFSSYYRTSTSTQFGDLPSETDEFRRCR